MVKYCKYCGEKFETENSRKVFCCRECKNKHQNEIYHSRRIGLEPPAKPRRRKNGVNCELVNFVLEAEKRGMRYAELQQLETLELIKAGKI